VTSTQSMETTQHDGLLASVFAGWFRVLMIELIIFWQALCLLVQKASRLRYNWSRFHSATSRSYSIN
jgi:hypothetical protein